jgi:hypothetical protein
MSAPRCTLLPDCAVVTARGRDARSFLQGQLTNDLLGLERHPGMLAAYCNRQGRVLATLRLAAAGERLLLVLDRRLAATLVHQLSRYVLRADVQFTDGTGELGVAGLLVAEPDAGPSIAAATAAGLTPMIASAGRVLLAGPLPALAAFAAALAPAVPADWERLAVADGEPLVQPETAALWLPQMLNLDLLGGVSFSKGCYVGQEVVARAQHLGRIKRRMLRYSGPPQAGLGPGHALFSGEALAAQVVTSVAHPAATDCLAVAELRYSSDLLGARPGGSEFVPAGLPYAIPVPTADADD